MKKYVVLFVCLLFVSGSLILPASATGIDDQNEQILVSETVEYISDNLYYVERIYIPNMQSFSNTKTGTKTAACVSSGTTIFAISVTGTFTYDGTTSDATSASYSIATYVENAKIKSGNAYTSGASAIATGSVSYWGITLQKTVTLTCDKNGNLS